MPRDDREAPLLTTREAAEFCRFKTTGAIRKAVREGRLRPAGRRGGRGCHMFWRADLEAFLCGLPPGTIRGEGRPCAPPPGGGHEHNEMGSSMEVLDRAEALETGRLAQEGRRVRGARAGNRSAHGPDAAAHRAVPGRRRR